jgi:hypothetical protein
MHITFTIRLDTNGESPIITVGMGNYFTTTSVSLKLVFILTDGLRSESFERSWDFRLPRAIPNILSLSLIGVQYSAAIFEGLLRGLQIGVINPVQDQHGDDSGMMEE